MVRSTDLVKVPFNVAVPSVVPGPAAWASARSLLKRQLLRSHAGPVDLSLWG